MVSESGVGVSALLPHDHPSIQLPAYRCTPVFPSHLMILLFAGCWRQCAATQIPSPLVILKCRRGNTLLVRTLLRVTGRMYAFECCRTGSRTTVVALFTALVRPQPLPPPLRITFHCYHYLQLQPSISSASCKPSSSDRCPAAKETEYIWRGC